MGKNIWKGFDEQGEKISYQSLVITGANLRQNWERKSLEPVSSEDAGEKPQQSVAIRKSRSSGSVKT